MNPLNTWKGKSEAAWFFAVQKAVQAVCYASDAEQSLSAAGKILGCGASSLAKL